MRASVPGTGYAEELQRLDEGLSAVLNADIDFGRPPAIAIDYRESPIASLLQQANAPLPPVEIDIAPDSLLKNVARQLLGQPVNCDHEVLPLPASINEAMDQIARLSQLTQSAFTELRSSRSANRLRRYYADAVTTLNDHPFGGDLTRRESIDLRRFLQVLDQVDLEASVCASLSWSRLGDPQWLDQLQRLLETHALAQHDIIAEQATEFGSIILSGSSSSTLQRENVLFLADLGGNDIYGLESTTRFSGLPQLIVDFSGNDRYESAYHGSIASGLGSVSILIDREGDDWYGSTSLSQGAA
ncbi:MAG: hypothetical protein RLO18_25530, partial [Gimesia chilikensis]